MLINSLIDFESQAIREVSLVSFGARVANAESCGRAFACDRKGSQQTSRRNGMGTTLT